MPNFKSFKFWLLVFCGSLFLYIGVCCLSLVYSIKSLDSKYIAHTAKDGEVEYQWVNKRPATWTPYRFISKELVYAIVVSEDWAFFEHHGYDPNQIQIAIDDWLQGNRKLRGASTITQQLAKNLFLNNDKLLSRKIKELFISVLMESLLSKQKILEVYLNVIEFGKDLYGVFGASGFYFQKRANVINPREAAFLAMLLPNPKRYSQSFRDRKLTPFAEKIITDILNKMVIAKYLTDMQRDWSLAHRFKWEPLPYTDEIIWELEE